MSDSTNKNPIFKKAEKNVTFKVEGSTDGEGYYSKGSTENGLVVLSEWWGFNQSICKTSDIISKEGYHTLVVDIYRGKVAEDSEEAGHLMKGLNFKSAVNDILEASKFLREKGCKNVGVIGFCMGGALALAAASADNNNNLQVALPYYGIPNQDDFPVKNIKCPVLMQVGKLDDTKGFSDPESCENLKKKAKEANVDFELIVWEGCKHAFMNQDSEKYDKVTAEKSLKMVCDWTKKKFNS